MKKLAICFMTFNRAKHIKEDLDIISQPTKEYGIDIYIYDGSTNARTEYVVSQFIKKGYDHIHYFRTDKDLSMVDSSIQRLTNVFKEPEAEYVWLCGDKFVIEPRYYPEILTYIDKAYDIITIYGHILNGTRIFNRPDRFVNYAIVPLTHWGSTIIKKELVEDFDITKERDKAKSFTITFLYLLAIDKNEFKGVVIDGGKKVDIVSRFKTLSNCMSYMWKSWIIDWYEFINVIPERYENIREKLYNRPDLQMGFFSIKELLRQRSERQFDLKKFMECRQYVKKVIIMPSIFVLCIAILPRRVAKWFYALTKYNFVPNR